jgi:hypothetical protein
MVKNKQLSQVQGEGIVDTIKTIKNVANNILYYWGSAPRFVLFIFRF